MTTETNSTYDYDYMYTKDYPDLGTEPIPIEPYVSSEYFNREMENIFKKSWMLICSENELKSPGDFIVKEIPPMNASIIITRDKENNINAFYNACKHRGNRLVYEECAGKNARGFTCPFHGWSYHLDGSLRGAPEKDRFFNLNEQDTALKKVNIQTWNGLVFICPAQNPDRNLREYLGSLAEDLDGYPFSKLEAIGQWSADLDANWKVAIDAFQEGYHVPVVHRRTVADVFSGEKTSACRLNNFRFHGNHRAATTPQNVDAKLSPTEVLSHSFAGASFTQKDGGDQVGYNKDADIWKGLNPGKEKNFGFDINVVFPSTSLLTSNGWFLTYEFWPISVNKTKWIARLYVVPPTSWKERIGKEFTMIQIREALLEDLASIENTQKGLESGGIDEILLSDQELALRHQYSVIERLLNES